MTEFKQIIGRGTRINEDYNKLFFTIMDFKRATALFADPDFDGDPVQIYEPGRMTNRRFHRTKSMDEGVIRIDPIPRTISQTRMMNPAKSPKKYYVNDVEVRVATERVQYLDANGKLITESLKDYSRKTVRKNYASLDDFLTVWKDADRKQVDSRRTVRQGVFLDELAEQVGRDYDAFDLDLPCRL